MTDLIWIISSCALILAVIVIRAIFAKRMSAGVRYALWGLVLIRLLIPGTVFSSPVSLTTAAMKTEIVQNAEAVKEYAYIERTDSGAVIGSPREGAAPKQPAYDTQIVDPPAGASVVMTEASSERFERMRKTLEIRDILSIVWYSGMGIFAAYFIATNVRFYIKLRAKRERLPVGIDCPVYMVDGLSSSCLFLSSVYISKETAEDEDALRLVLAHECAHRRHADGFTALLRSAALVLHWYNPLVWIAAFLSRRDSELFADAGAIKAIGDEEREHYGRVLIELASGAKTYAPIGCAATMMTSGKAELKSRVRGIANRRRMGFLIGAAVLILAAAAVFTVFCGESRDVKAGGPYPMYEGSAPKALGVAAAIPDTPPYTPYICDLDRDGREDTVRLETVGEGRAETRRVTVELGAHPLKLYTFEQEGAVSSKLYFIDCDTADSRGDMVFVYLTEEDGLRFWMLRVSGDGKSVERFVPDPSVRIVMNDMSQDPRAGFYADNGIPVTVRDADDADKYWFTRLTLTEEGFKMLIPLQAEIDTGSAEKPIEKSGSVQICFYNEPTPESCALDTKNSPIQKDEYVIYTATITESARIRNAVNSIKGWTDDNIVDRMGFTFAGQFQIRNGDGLFYFTEDGFIYTWRDGSYYFGQMTEEDAEFLMGLREKAQIPDVHEETDNSELKLLGNFFELTDEEGIRNGDKLFDSYVPSNPMTWKSKLTGSNVEWDENGHILAITLAGLENSAVLCGELDLRELPKLKSIHTEGFIMDSIRIEDCPLLDSIELDAAASYAKLSGAKPGEGFRIAVYWKLECELSERGSSQKTLTFDVDLHNGGGVVVAEYIDYADQILLHAVPYEGNELNSWEDEPNYDDRIFGIDTFDLSDSEGITDENGLKGDCSIRVFFTEIDAGYIPEYEWEAPKTAGVFKVLDEGVPYETDIDFDGLTDTMIITEADRAQSDGKGYDVVFTLGSRPYEPYTFSYDEVVSCTVRVLDCDVDDGRLDIIMYYYLDGGGEVDAFRAKRDGSGMAMFHLMPEGWLETQPHEWQKTDGELDISNGLPVWTRTEILDTQTVFSYVTVTDDGFRRLTPHRFEDPNAPSAHGFRELKRDLRVTPKGSDRDTDSVLIPAGSKLAPYETDGRTYLDLITPDGFIGRVDIKIYDFSDVMIDGIIQDEYFEIWAAG